MIGVSVGNFKIVSRLGRGGMGEVYQAEHKDLQTPVAIKLLSPDISGHTDYVQRFFNEARVVSKIKHAGTVKIFDSGFHDDQAYLIMELLEGEALAARIERLGTLPTVQLMDIARQITSVLDATHRQGVIHRDLKPDNIFLVHDDERPSGERVKILDFGIAKLSGTMAAVSPKTKGTMGTPLYMAPEQWGDSSNVDWRSDAYSLGCVMFEMACGAPPFEIDSIADAFIKHTTQAPPAPRSRRPDLPPALESLVMRLLAKDPAERATSMGQITRELDELLGATTSGTYRYSTPAHGVPAISTTTSSPPEARPPATQADTLSRTTLGASAAELQVVKRRSAALLGMIGAGTVAAVIVAVLVATRSGRHAAAKAGVPGPGTTTEAPGAPTAAPANVAPTPAPVPPPTDTGSAAMAASGSATPPGADRSAGSAGTLSTPTTATSEGPTVTPPATKPTTKAATKPATKPTTKPATKPATKPTAKPTTKPTAKPTTKPATPPPSGGGDDLGGRL